MQATSETKDTSITMTLTFDVGLVPGLDFNLWFGPTLNCQSMTVTCNGQDISIENCTPQRDGDGRLVGQHGVVTVG